MAGQGLETKSEKQHLEKSSPAWAPRSLVAEPPPWVGSRGRAGAASSRAEGSRGRRGAQSRRCKGGGAGEPGCALVPRWSPLSRRLADLRAEPGGLASRTGAAGARAGSPRGREAGLAGTRYLVRAGWAWGAVSAVPGQSRSPEAPRRTGCQNERNNLDLPTCWESSVLVLPPCELGVGLKLAWVVGVMAGPAEPPSTAGRRGALGGCLDTLAAGWQGDPRTQREPCLTQGELQGPLWPLSSCRCPQAPREGAEESSWSPIGVPAEHLGKNLILLLRTELRDECRSREQTRKRPEVSPAFLSLKAGEGQSRDSPEVLWMGHRRSMVTRVREAGPTSCGHLQSSLTLPFHHLLPL